LNRPETFEAWQVWELAMNLGGQFRAIPGGVVGWDMGAAIALGRAAGVGPIALAEFLPVIEPLAVQAVNARARGGRDG
jgi:hypothetical protein